MKNIFKQEKIMLQLRFSPGLALTGFWTTRPWALFTASSWHNLVWEQNCCWHGGCGKSTVCPFCNHLNPLNGGLVLSASREPHTLTDHITMLGLGFFLSGETELGKLFFFTPLEYTGLLVGCRKKVKFRGIFRDKFAERNGRFWGNFRGQFRWKTIIGKERPI